MNRFTPALSMTLLTLSGLALAATVNPNSPTLSLSLMKVTVVTKDGVKQEVLSPADKVNPGDMLLQRATLRSPRALKNGNIILPVPKNTRFLSGTASTFKDYKMDFSADSGKTFSAQPTKTVTVTENGKSVTKQVPVPETDYTSVRWNVTSLPAGGEVTVDFRVAVN